MSEGKKINPKSIMRVMERTIKELVARNTGSRKVVSKANALKPLAENKNRRGVVVIKNIRKILDDPTKLQSLRRLTREVISEKKRIQAGQVNELIRRIKENPDIVTQEGLEEIYTPTFTNYMRNIDSPVEGVESKQEKEPEVKIQKPLDVIDIKASTKELKAWLDSNASKYYESLASSGEDQQSISQYYANRLDEFQRRMKKENKLEEFTERELTEQVDKDAIERKVKVSEPTIAQRTQDDGPKIIMTQPKIKSLPTTNQELRIVQKNPIYKEVLKEIKDQELVSLINPGYAFEFANIDTSMIPASIRFIIDPMVERLRSIDYEKVAEGFALFIMVSIAVYQSGVDPKSTLGNVITTVRDKIGTNAINELINQVTGKGKPKELESKQPDKKKIKIPDEPDAKQPDEKQPEAKQPDAKQIGSVGLIPRGIQEIGLGAGIVGTALSAIVNFGNSAGRGSTATTTPTPPTQVVPTTTPSTPTMMENVIDTGITVGSAGAGAMTLDDLRRRAVELVPELRPTLDTYTAEVLTYIIGAALGKKVGDVVKEKTPIKQVLKETAQAGLGIKETPIAYDPSTLEKAIVDIEQKPTRNKVWQPKTIYPSTSILDESKQEKYIDDLETSAFDYIAPTSEGSAGTIYTNPLKRQQYINERIRLEGGGMYIPYQTWGRVNDPSKMTEEQLRLMLLGPKLPQMKFEPMNNATTFENVQTVHLVNNEQNSIEMFSPYSQFSNVDNNWWSNENSVLYTINP